MLELDTKELKKAQHRLERKAKDGVAWAIRRTLDEMAFQGRREYVRAAKKQMTLRNANTVRSIQFTKVKTMVIEHMESRYGSVENYMDLQERGGVERAKGKEGVAIPTNVAATGSESSAKRLKDVRANMRVSRVQLRNKRIKGRSQGVRNKRKVVDAVKSGKRYIYMDLGRRKGIFRVKGGSKARKLHPSHGVIGARVQMIHDLTRKSVSIPKNPMMARTHTTMRRRFDALASKNLTQQLRRALR